MNPKLKSEAAAAAFLLKPCSSAVLGWQNYLTIDIRSKFWYVQSYLWQIVKRFDLWRKHCNEGSTCNRIQIQVPAPLYPHAESLMTPRSGSTATCAPSVFRPPWPSMPASPRRPRGGDAYRSDGQTVGQLCRTPRQTDSAQAPLRHGTRRRLLA